MEEKLSQEVGICPYQPRCCKLERQLKREGVHPPSACLLLWDGATRLADRGEEAHHPSARLLLWDGATRPVDRREGARHPSARLLLLDGASRPADRGEEAHHPSARLLLWDGATGLADRREGACPPSARLLLLDGATRLDNRREGARHPSARLLLLTGNIIRGLCNYPKMIHLHHPPKKINTHLQYCSAYFSHVLFAYFLPFYIFFAILFLCAIIDVPILTDHFTLCFQ
jgi:hypothetical protein